jgi:hypothetical protein
MPVCESNRGAVVDDERLRRLYSWPSWCFLDVRHVGMRYTVRSRVMLQQQEQLLLAPDGSGSHTHALRRRLAGLGRMGVGVCCIQAEYHALPRCAALDDPGLLRTYLSRRAPLKDDQNWRAQHGSA